ncbi:MAG: hypothetical protein WD894_08015 [Pirellulales bacterium]
MLRPTFTGGPYDGLQPIDWTNYRIGDEVEVPISANLLNMLNGEFCGPAAALSGIAVYRFDLSKFGMRFLFVRRRAVRREERSRLEVWHREAVQRVAKKEPH